MACTCVVITAFICVLFKKYANVVSLINLGVLKEGVVLFTIMRKRIHCLGRSQETIDSHCIQNNSQQNYPDFVFETIEPADLLFSLFVDVPRPLSRCACATPCPAQTLCSKQNVR